MKKFLLLLGFLLLPIHSLFASDVEIEKLQWHLNRVEGILRKVDTSSLTEIQKENRTKMLDRLHSYTEIGKFPNNEKFPGESVPFFRGSNGNLCAAGYLMAADPEYASFIENIVKTNNTVRIMDVQNDPTLNVWAKKYGFSILELAMIQPTYDYKNRNTLNMSGGSSASDTFGSISLNFLKLTFFFLAPFLLLKYLNYRRIQNNRTPVLGGFLFFFLLIPSIILGFFSLLFAVGVVYPDFIEGLFNAIIR